jgi:hypothetical protein
MNALFIATAKVGFEYTPIESDEQVFFGFTGEPQEAASRTRFSVVEKRRGESDGKGEISPRTKSELISRPAVIKHEIEALEKLSK